MHPLCLVTLSLVCFLEQGCDSLALSHISMQEPRRWPRAPTCCGSSYRV